MNCKHVQELLPLYVSRDLEEKPARLVRAHVQSCAECAGSVAEYHETRRLLQEFAPPPFSEAVYAEIRQRVLREIEREAPEAPRANASSLPLLVAGLFRPRLRWAVVTVLLLAVSLFAFYFIANRGNGRRQVAVVQPKAPPTRPDAAASISPSIPAPRDNNGPPFKGTDRNKGAEIAGSGAHTHPSQRKKSLGVADRQTTVAVNEPDQRSTGAEANPARNNPDKTDAGFARDPAASEKTLRLEIQTQDPNIRIIWFSHERTKQDSRGKSSKGV